MVEVLKVNTTQAPPVPPVDVASVEVRLTADEARTIGKVFGSVSPSILREAGEDPLTADRLWLSMKRALNVTSFGPINLSPKVSATEADAAKKIDRLKADNEQLRAQASALSDALCSIRQQVAAALAS